MSDITLSLSATIFGLPLPVLLASLVGGYLLGSVPFGLVLSYLAGYGDIRRIGSGNIGATNVLRTGNKPLAAATLVLDSGKGALASLLAGWITGYADLAMLAGAGAMLGHMFPVWLRFRGGKGVATAIGVLLVTRWPVGIAACVLWLATAALVRISSLSALVAIAAAIPLAFIFGDSAQGALASFIAVLVFIRHDANIRRLIAGTEPRISRGARTVVSPPK
ncbi:MAG: glycerol-3-phosphate 1-O-acyltransferase PlsY [Azospirillaceae bacterium]|nr:glycerol-3-phosphate 1-O-acyltransferase PlsY [Azospirillaceae bacterium]